MFRKDRRPRRRALRFGLLTAKKGRYGKIEQFRETVQQPRRHPLAVLFEPPDLLRTDAQHSAHLVAAEIALLPRQADQLS